MLIHIISTYHTIIWYHINILFNCYPIISFIFNYPILILMIQSSPHDSPIRFLVTWILPFPMKDSEHSCGFSRCFPWKKPEIHLKSWRVIIIIIKHGVLENRRFFVFCWLGNSSTSMISMVDFPDFPCDWWHPIGYHMGFNPQPDKWVDCGHGQINLIGDWVGCCCLKVKFLACR